MIKDNIYCPICHNYLIYSSKIADPSLLDMICPACKHLHIVNNNIMKKYLKWEIAFNKKLIKDLFSQDNANFAFILMMNIRESIVDLDQDIRRTQFIHPDKINQISIDAFIKMESALRIFLELKNNLNYFVEEFDTSKFISNLNELFEKDLSLKELEHGNCIFVKDQSTKSIEKYKYGYYFQRISSISQYGLGNGESIPLSTEDAYRVENLVVGDENGLYLLLLQQFFTIFYLSLPSHSYKQYTFENLGKDFKKFVSFFHDFIIFWIEKIDQSQLGQDSSDLKFGKKFYSEFEYLNFKNDSIEFISKKINNGNNQNLEKEAENKFKFIESHFILTNGKSHSPAVFIRDPTSSKIYMGLNSLHHYKRLIEIGIRYDEIHDYFGKKLEPEMIRIVLNRFDKHNIKYSDDSTSPIILTGIIIRKNGNEIDVIGIKDEKLFFFELKAFIPHLKFDSNNKNIQNLRKLNKTEHNFLDKDKIYDWLKFSFSNKDNNQIKIKCRKKNMETRKEEQIELKFNNLHVKKVIPVFMQQMKDIPNPFSSKINVICLDDLDEFLDQKEYSWEYELNS